MRKLLCIPFAFVATCVVSMFLLVSCVTDDRYSLSKEVDTTIGVGKGFAFPLGSTEKVYLSELIDTENVDILETDQVGNYVLSTGGDFSTTTFQLENTDLHFDIREDEKYFKIEIKDLSKLEGLPLMEQKIPYAVHDTVEYQSIFDLYHEGLPKEIKRLRKIEFKAPVELLVSVKISSGDPNAKEMLKTAGVLHLKGLGENEYFQVEFPEFVVLGEDADIVDHKLMLHGDAVYDDTEQGLIYSKTVKVECIDFSETATGYIEIKDGVIDIKEFINVVGELVSETVYYSVADLTHLNSVKFVNQYTLGDIQIDMVEGVFEPERTEITESINLDFGEDLDFLKNAYLDLTDPRIYLTLNNNTPVPYDAAGVIAGYDSDNNEIADSRMELNLKADANAQTKVLLDRYATPVEGWTNYQLANLNELLKNIPDRIDFNFNAGVYTGENYDLYSTVKFGEDMVISGEYRVDVPLAFDSLRLEYTYSIDDVFGTANDEPNGYSVENAGGETEEDGEGFTDYVKEIRGLSLSLNVLNTLPLGFAPTIKMYDEEGALLNIANVGIEGCINRGTGIVDGVVGNPVKSPLKFKIASLDEDLENIYRIEINLVGTGKGVLNSNEYIQITDISLNVDDYIVLDLDLDLGLDD